MISPRTPKSSSVDSSRVAFCSRASAETAATDAALGSARSGAGAGGIRPLRDARRAPAGAAERRLGAPAAAEPARLAIARVAGLRRGRRTGAPARAARETAGQAPWGVGRERRRHGRGGRRARALGAPSPAARIAAGRRLERRERLVDFLVLVERGSGGGGAGRVRRARRDGRGSRSRAVRREAGLLAPEAGGSVARRPCGRRPLRRSARHASSGAASAALQAHGRAWASAPTETMPQPGSSSWASSASSGSKAGRRARGGVSSRRAALWRIGEAEAAGRGGGEDGDPGEAEADERRERTPPMPVITLAAWRRPSPATPPSPVGRGQRCVGGSELATAVAAPAPRIQRPRRSGSRSRPPVRTQPPAPGGERHGEGDRAEPEELHREVGHDRARTLEEVADRRRGGVVEARVVDRPGRERRDRRAGQGDQAKAHDLHRPTAQEGAQRVRKVVERRGSAGGSHAGSRLGRGVEAANPKEGQLRRV